MYLTPVKKDDGANGDDDKKESPVPNPNYETWIAKDQQLLNYLLSSLSKEIFFPSHIFSRDHGHCMGRH